MERAIAEMTAFSGPQVADPTRCLVKQHYFLFGGCERNGMNFDEADPTRCLLKQRIISIGDITLFGRAIGVPEKRQLKKLRVGAAIRRPLRVSNRRGDAS